MITLNQSQDKAVKTIDRNLLVLAGAGTGKTRIIIAKIIYLISQGVHPRNILAITFTNKAADEMRTRLKGFFSKQKGVMEILEVRTFHSFGAMILRNFIHHLPPYSLNFTIIDDQDQKRILKELITEKMTDQEIKGLIKLFSDCKNKLYYPDDLQFSAFQERDRIPQFRSGLTMTDFTFKLYKTYCNHLKTYNLLDFDDLIGLTVKLLQGCEPARKFTLNRWKYLLVDEYQDTNLSQEMLLELFISANNLVTVVGDDSQSIYSFRGAHVENILSFEKKYKKENRPVDIVKLEENYRSTQSILNLANRVIQLNPVKYEKNLITNQEVGEKPSYRIFPNELYEVNWIYERIKQLLENGDSPEEVAVIYRTNYQSRMIEEILIRNQIPYRILGGFRFYERKEIKELMSYLNFLLNPRDFVNFFRILSFPPKGIGEKSQEKIRNFLENWHRTKHSNEQRNGHFDEREESLDQLNFSIQSLIQSEDFSKNFKTGRAVEQFDRLFELMEQGRQMMEEKAPISKIVDHIVEGSQIYTHYTNLKNTFERDQRLGNLDAFMDAVIYYEDHHPREVESLSKFMEGISLGLENAANQNLDRAEKKVSLLTGHNAKGMEFGTVFLMGLEEGTFPHYLSLEEDNPEEERRLFYVAITRAKKALYLSSSEMKRRQGYEQFFEPSRFVRESGDEVLEKVFNDFSTDFSYDMGEGNEYF